jgi:hypothetical protein
MTGPFDERERSFEGKWVRDEAWRFKVHARRDKLLGLWAAGEMGLTEMAAEAYAAEIVAADLAKAGEHDVFAKIRADFDRHGIALSDHLIRRKMEALLKLADEQIQAELRG